MDQIREFGAALGAALSPEARAGLIAGPAVWGLYNLWMLAGDDRGLAHRLYPFGHKLLVLLVFGWILSRIGRRDLFAVLLWGGATAMVAWSAIEFLGCSLYLDPFDRSVIDLWGAGARHACAMVIAPAAPYVPWLFFGPAFGYLVWRFGAAVWRAR